MKKVMAAVAALLVAASMMTACASGTGSGNGSSSTASTASGTTATPDENGKVNGVMNAKGLPIVEPGSYSFTLFVDDSQEDDDYVMFPILEEQTGVKVELQKFPNAVATEKLSLALNSGDYADCIGGWTLTANDVLNYGMNEGVFVPLDEIYANYCPKITEILDLEGVREIMTTPDNHIYSIPYAIEAPLVDFQPFINTAWLKNVGMEMPKTTDEFEAVLKAFKEKDANGNGDPNDEIPFTSGPDNLHLTYLCGYFGKSVYYKDGFTMNGDQLEFGANTEEFKNGIKWLAKLYKEGLIDPEIFTQDAAQWKAKGAQDIYGCSIMYASADIMPYDPGVVPNWEAVPVLSSPTCDKPVWLRDTYGTAVLKNQVVITDNAKNPEVIARWWDNVFEFENSLQIDKGPLDKVVFKEGEDYRKINVAEMSDADQKLYDWGNLFPQSLPKYIPNGFRVKEDVPAYQEKPPADKVYESALTEAIPEYWVSADDATRLADFTTAFKDYLGQKVAEWVSGQTDIDADWDSYLAQLDKLKLQEFVELRQSVLK